MVGSTNVMNIFALCIRGKGINTANLKNLVSKPYQLIYLHTNIISHMLLDLLKDILYAPKRFCSRNGRKYDHEYKYSETSALISLKIHLFKPDIYQNLTSLTFIQQMT